MSALLHRDPVPPLAPAASDETDAAQVYTACVLRGLSRLPAHFGVAYSIVAAPAGRRPPIGAYPVNRTFVEPSILAAVAVPLAPPPGREPPVELAIWSRSGRRADGLAPVADPVVLFAPGTRLRVLAVDPAVDAAVDPAMDPAADAAAARVYLAEPGDTAGDDGAARVLARLRTAVGVR